MVRTKGNKKHSRINPIHLGKSRIAKNDNQHLKRIADKKLLDKINKAFNKKDGRKSYNPNGRLDISIRLGLKARNRKVSISFDKPDWICIADNLESKRINGDYRFNKFMMLNYIKEMIKYE